MTMTLHLSAKLIDYSHADYIPIHDGDIIIWKDYNYLKHSTNLTLYDTIIDETNKLMDIFPKTHMKKILHNNIDQIETLLSTLRTHHRQARSLNFLGTTLKIIAGTPDFDDFQGIKFHQNQLIESHNRQTEINTKINQQMQKITTAINSLISANKLNEIDSEKLYETLLARNRIIITNLQNLILSISLAKVNIVDPNILDNDEINTIIKNDNFTETSVSEIMYLADIKVFQNVDLLFFIIKYPIPLMKCKKISVFPVAHHQKILSLKPHNQVAHCEHQTTAVSNCKSTIKSTFCNLNDLATCAQQLVSGIPAQCSTEFNGLEKVTTVEDGILIINDIPADIIEDGVLQHKNKGTYLVMFENEIIVNGTKYVNRNNIISKKPGLPNLSIINVTEHKNILSLPLLHEMNTINIERIADLKSKIVTVPIVSVATALLAALTLIIIVKLVTTVRRKNTLRNLRGAVDEILRKSEDGLKS